MIRASAASFNPDTLVAVISANVSRNVEVFLVQAGPISCKMLEMPIDESDPSDGETLLATPDASAPRDGCPDLMTMLLLLSFAAMMESISCFGRVSRSMTLRV